MSRKADGSKLNLSVDEQLLSGFEGQVPRHVAIIMDGNGRWATSRGMNRLRGHHEGANAVRRVVESCRYLGVEILTLYAFSSQNWQRPVDEVSGLMALFDLYIQKERKQLIENNVAVKIIGDRERLGPKLQAAIAQLEAATAPGAQMILQVAVSYGGRDEILRATRALAKRAQAGELDPTSIDETTFAAELYTADQPDPDLVIRTSGEFRISNFLLWQIAYSEIYVSDVLWPDFNEARLLEAFADFGGRERRFGLTGEQVKS